MEDWGSDFAEDEQEAMHDDDDTSWKVRRSAIKIIDATIKTRPEFVKTIVNNYSIRLVSRFKERIDDVKCDLLDTFRDLLATSVESGPSTMENELRHQSSISREKSYNIQIHDASAKIIKALIKQIKSKSLKVRISTFQCIGELSRAIQFRLDTHIPELFPELYNTINETTSFEPFIESLKILRRLFRTYTLGTKCNFMEHNNEILNMLIYGLKHDYSKVVSLALNVTGSFLNCLRDT